METRANYVLVGVFTLAAVVGIVGFVFWIAGVGRFSNRPAYQIVFKGSIAGLLRGGPVLFNGVRVGEVQQIAFFPKDPSQVAATVVVDSGTPIRADTKARLEPQGLTGSAAVELSGGASNAPPLKPSDGFAGVIFAEPSQIQNIIENVQSLSTKADALLTRIDSLVSGNSENINVAVANIADLTKSLNQNGSGISGALRSIGDLSNSLGPTAQELQKVVARVDTIVAAVDEKKVSDIVANADKFSKALGDNSEGIDKLLSQLGGVARNLDPVIAEAKDLVATLNKIAENVDMKKVDATIDNLQAFSATLADARPQVQSITSDIAGISKKFNAASGDITGAFSDFDATIKAVDPKKVASISDGLASFADTLKANRDNVDTFLSQAADLSKKLNASADKLDGLINSVTGVTSGGDGKNAIAEVSAAASSVRSLADEINQRVKDIAPGLTRFSASGLREYEGLAVDGRRMVNDVDRAVKSFERNPSQLIFGAKSGLPEYYGGR
jgi:phospholipid/cholesterol/gamma-HCH transport system substrate-binding protein